MKLPFTIATWNINSVRLRAALVTKLLREEGPDILCLQECKSPVDKIPAEVFAAAGYPYMVARGQKGYNGYPLPKLDHRILPRSAMPAISLDSWKAV